jgi:hypothetical protein
MIPVLGRFRQLRYPGLYRATVVNATDPLLSQRVQVRIPFLSRAPSVWAPTIRDLGGRPQVGDEVLVGFDAGQPEHPYVVGVLATGPAPPVTLSDENGNSVSLAASGIEITSGTEVHIRAATIRFTSATGSADSAQWTYSGVVKSQALIADTVVAAQYSPGAGNIM